MFVCVCDFYKCILLAIDELCKALTALDRRGAVRILIIIIIIIRYTRDRANLVIGYDEDNANESNTAQRTQSRVTRWWFHDNVSSVRIPTALGVEI